MQKIENFRWITGNLDPRCNCRVSERRPLGSNNLAKNIIYKAVVTSDKERGNACERVSVSVSELEWKHDK